MAEFKVLGCGLSTLDIVQYVAVFPSANQKVVAREMALSAGGPALNATLVARALGAHATLVTAIGGGAISDLINADLATADVEVVDLSTEDATPAVSTVLVSAQSGERAVVSVNATGMGTLQSAPMFTSSSAAALLVDGHHMAICQTLAEAAQSAGVPVLFDGGSWKPGTDSLLHEVDCAILSADFTLDGLKNPRLVDVAKFGPRWVVRTNGGGEVEYHDSSNDKSGSLPVPSVPVVDTLGAGDNFHGAMLAFVGARGLSSENFVEAISFGVDIASLSCRYPGARGWIAAGEARFIV